MNLKLPDEPELTCVAQRGVDDDAASILELDSTSILELDSTSILEPSPSILEPSILGLLVTTAREFGTTSAVISLCATVIG
jgi:hypothetical protein